MPLEPVFHNRVRVIDIDGTVVRKKPPEEYFTTPTVALPGAIERVNKWFANGDYIIFWTARPNEYKQRTMDILDELGFNYHELICGKPYTHKMHFYDDIPVLVVHRVMRDKGIGDHRRKR